MIGEKIRAKRLELGLTQQELANKIGDKSKSTINKIELNKHDVSQTKLVKIADALGVSPVYFIQDDPVFIEMQTVERLRSYADKISKLNDKNRESVLNYIDYLYETEKKEDES